jgi:TetR/AcrR family transcriptional regulator, regulator of cefoperazone and chloramphenicol sensitivity
MVSTTLLQTAIEQFGRLGFEGASTRDIARASGTAMSSITYHFGGKEGLYLAAADHIAESIAAMQAPVLEAVKLSGAVSREAAIEALLRIIDSMAMMMLRPESEDWARFIIREQQAPTEAFDRLYNGVMKNVLGAVTGLLARVRPDYDDRTLRASAILLVGQTMMLRAGRAAVCRALDADTIDEPLARLLRGQLRANTLCILSEKPE